MDRNELAAKHKGTLVGGRVVVVFNGKAEYITDVGQDGNWQINALGKQLEENYVAPVKTPKAAKAA